ncbi:hypothetical protein [Arenicella xantha]|uniref:Uncharacterized protein n=1 Tax=Arenicella xantha TaxID=644221 RepID=A0A395JGZ7_9GAMM|nr:hypothetical protein [Arenicella xantha]RBP48809.1 hypothetical protein DFR28_105148 [Arenicella xantha]
MLSLKNVMRANATSCLAFGALFALQPSLVANFLGGASPAPESYILILGILLILNGLHLLWASRVPLAQKELILYFSTGDYIWVIGSVGLMISGVWITTAGGMLVASAVALMVGLFGILQMTTRKAMGHC